MKTAFASVSGTLFIPLRLRLKVLFAFFFCAFAAHGVTISEDFSSDPAQSGWKKFGNTNLFRWNATNGNLEVTWDSFQTNSYFYKPLGTILNKHDDFSLSFDLRMSDLAIGITPERPYTFPLAIGFLNLENATHTNFFRGTGRHSPNLVEFAYFADSGYGETFALVVVSTNSGFVPAHTFPLQLTMNDLFHIVLNYSSSNKQFSAVITRNGQPFGPIEPVLLGDTFTDFRVNAVSINSYSHARQHPDYSGSLLAHGVVDNILITVPPPPIQNIIGTTANGQWQVEFNSRTNWNYVLQRTDDFQSWTNVSAQISGTGGGLMLQDTNAASSSAQFYRVKAQLPD